MTALELEFNQLFNELYQWKTKARENISVDMCQEFMRLSLRIALIMVSDQKLRKILCTQLSLIIDAHDHDDVLSELEESFSDVDRDLEEHLRGFNNLLHFVLEDEMIRRDPKALLEKVPSISDDIENIFLKLSSSLLAYLDLDDALTLNAKMTPVLIFLMAQEELLHVLINKPSCDIICTWLEDCVTNESITTLFKESRKIFHKGTPLDSGFDKTKELLLMKICRKVSEKDFLSEAEAVLIDAGLKRFGLVGLEPLLQAGFLTMQEEVNRDNNKRSAAKIVRLF